MDGLGRRADPVAGPGAAGADELRWLEEHDRRTLGGEADRVLLRACADDRLQPQLTGPGQSQRQGLVVERVGVVVEHHAVRARVHERLGGHAVHRRAEPLDVHPLGEDPHTGAEVVDGGDERDREGEQHGHAVLLTGPSGGGRHRLDLAAPQQVLGADLEKRCGDRRAHAPMSARRRSAVAGRVSAGSPSVEHSRLTAPSNPISLSAPKIDGQSRRP